MRNLNFITLAINGTAIYPLSREFSKHDMGLIKKNPVGSTFGMLSHAMYQHEDDDPKILVQPHGGEIIRFQDVTSIDIDAGRDFSARISRKELRHHYDLAMRAGEFSYINPQAGYINAGPCGWIERERVAEIGEAFSGLFGKDLPRSGRIVPSDSDILQTVFVSKASNGDHKVYRVRGTYPTVGDPDWVPGPTG